MRHRFLAPSLILALALTACDQEPKTTQPADAPANKIPPGAIVEAALKPKPRPAPIEVRSHEGRKVEVMPGPPPANVKIEQPETVKARVARQSAAIEQALVEIAPQKREAFFKIYSCFIERARRAEAASGHTVEMTPAIIRDLAAQLEANPAAADSCTDEP